MFNRNEYKYKAVVTKDTYKDKKGGYGRYIGELFLGDVNINQEMLNKGYAVKY